MADDTRRFDDLVRTVAELRQQVGALQATTLNRIATHIHPGGGGGGGVTDHGALTGLGDDDHPQYLLGTEYNALANTLSSGEATVPRVALSSTQAPTSGAVLLNYFTALRTETISQVRIPTGGTAAGATPTVCQMAVFSVDPGTGDLTQIGVTANDTSLFAAQNTDYLRSFGASFAKTVGARYAFGLLLVSAAAMPTFHGPVLNNSAVAGALMARAPRILGQVTGQTSMPSTISAGSITNPAPRSIYAELLP